MAVKVETICSASQDRRHNWFIITENYTKSRKRCVFRWRRDLLYRWKTNRIDVDSERVEAESVDLMVKS